MKTLLTIAFLTLIYGGLHTQLAIVSAGQVLVPYAVSGAGAIGIIVLFPHRFSLSVLRWFAFLFGVLAIMAVITATRAGDLTPRLVSAANLVYSLVIGYSAFVAIGALGVRWCSRIFLAAAILLVVGSFCELYAGLRPLSDAFRNATQRWHSQYAGVYGGVNGDIRDRMLYGAIRPKLFALEPSVLGISAGTSILYWFLSSATFTRLRLLAAGCLAMGAFLLIRSPTIFLCLFMVCEFFVADWLWSGSSGVRRAMFGACMLIGLTALPFVTTFLVHYTHGGSFLSREIIPGIMTAAVLRSYPFWGTGLGGYQEWGQFAFSAINSKWGSAAYGLLFRTLVTGGPYGARFMVSNGFWEFWMDCGLAGGMIVLFSLLRILRGLLVPDRLFVLCVAAVAFTAIGGVSSAAEWIPLFSVAALYREHCTGRKAYVGGLQAQGSVTDLDAGPIGKQMRSA